MRTSRTHRPSDEILGDLVASFPNPEEAASHSIHLAVPTYKSEDARGEQRGKELGGGERTQLLRGTTAPLSEESGAQERAT